MAYDDKHYFEIKRMLYELNFLSIYYKITRVKDYVRYYLKCNFNRINRI